MSAIQPGQPSEDAFVLQLRGRIDRLATQLRHRRMQGWDMASLDHAAHEVEHLHAAAGRVEPGLAALLAQLRGPLSAARLAQRVPDATAAANLVATAEQLLLRLPPRSPADTQAGARLRAEVPPPGYWRRWADDAPPPPPPPAPLRAPPTMTPPHPRHLPPPHSKHRTR